PPASQSESAHQELRIAFCGFSRSSKPKRQAAETTIHLLKLRHLESRRLIARPLKHSLARRKARGNQDLFVYLYAIGCVFLTCRHAQYREVSKLRPLRSEERRVGKE